MGISIQRMLVDDALAGPSGRLAWDGEGWVERLMSCCRPCGRRERRLLTLGATSTSLRRRRTRRGTHAKDSTVMRWPATSAITCTQRCAVIVKVEQAADRVAGAR